MFAAVAQAATSLDSGDAAIIGSASTGARAAALTCDAAGVNIQLDVVANNGQIPDNNSYPASGTVTAPTALSVTSTGLVASGSQAKTFDHSRNFNGSPQTLTFQIALSAASGANAGSQSFSITFGETGTMVLLGEQVDLGPSFTNPQVHVDVTCNPNTAPSVPGAPTLAAGSSTPNQGVFTLEWTASTDSQDDPITYELQHKNSSAGATFSTVASALTANSYAFTSAAREAEGTWTYQVRASDGSLASAYSSASSAIKVDRSAPTAPTASFSPTAADYNDGSINWWNEAVTVSFGGSTDPALADASVGSGVATYTTAQSFNTTGTHNYSGTATDNAGNQSAATSGTVGVDVTAPTISFDGCPTTAVLLNSSISLGWTASDGTGQSGLATAATGSVSLLTSSVGTKTATTPIARDNVGNESAAATCTYTVGYNFIGFDRPVDNNGVLNVVKAGQAVPLKFRLLDANNQPVLSGVTASVTVVNLSCDRATTSDLLEELATGGSGLQNLGDGYYQFNWATSKTYANSCKTMRLNLGEGAGGTALYHTADFEFRK